MAENIVIDTDGGAQGNPGRSAIGVVINNKGYSEYIGEGTNNEAEYKAVIFALKKTKALLGKERLKEAEIELKSDSELLVKQLSGEYKIMEPRIQQFFIEIWNIKIDFGKIKFTLIPREKNGEADKLVNRALDERRENKSLF